jgi:SNF2 family DNA or RNA helicase
MQSVYNKWCSLVGLDINPHQIQGFNWCTKREKDPETSGGIICDEMGLGKTILILGCIVTNKKAHTLIVVPPALLNQWKECIKKFLFNHEVFIWHGAIAKKTTLEELKEKPIVLTTYGMIATRKKGGYKSKLWSIHWDRLIYDEAHHMRNYKTSTCKGAFHLTSDIKWLVTGTPIQNKKSDLRVLFALLGKVLRGEKEFIQHIKKFVLRRTKKNVGIKLPEIETENIMVSWESKLEKNLAASIHSALRFSEVSVENVNEIMEYLNYDSPLPLYVRARQVCIDPNLLKNMIQKMKRDGVIPVSFKLKKIPTTSKLTAVINKIKSQPKELRKIIFCHFRSEIDALSRSLKDSGYTIAHMDGRTKKRDRLTACQPTASDEFLNFSGLNCVENHINRFLAPDCLIAQINSASEGLNLQHFSQVYFTSPHWNPAVEDQAIARAHRIGQKLNVQVFRFQMKPFEDNTLTLDNYCMFIQEKKRELMKLIEPKN